MMMDLVLRLSNGVYVGIFLPPQASGLLSGCSMLYILFTRGYGSLFYRIHIIKALYVHDCT